MFAVLSVSAADPPETTTPLPIGEAPSALSQFVGGLRVDVLPPRAIDRREADYLVWISGADGNDADLLRQWATAIADFGPQWIAEAFVELDPAASSYASLAASGPPTTESAEAHQALFARRDQLAQTVLQREADYLRTMLPELGDGGLSMETVANRALMARACEAVTLGRDVSGHLVPSVLGLMHQAAMDSRTSPSQAAAVRQFALDSAPRILEQRRMTVQAYVRLVCRSVAAHASARQRGVDPNPPLRALYRPVALAFQRTAAINRETIAALADLVPPEVAAEVDRAYREVAYGDMGVDLFDYSGAAAIAMGSLRDDELAKAVALMQTDTERRQRIIDEVCRDFDTAAVHCFERARSRDRDEGDRFLRRLVRAHERQLRDASETLAQLRDLTLHANADWSPGAFDVAVDAWRKEVQLRVRRMVGSGILWLIVTPDQVAEADPTRSRTGSLP